MNKSLAIMQPYFFPYLGYFQLLNYVDEFVIYDDVQYMKGGWVNRNRILQDGKPAFITIPVKKGNLQDTISEKEISIISRSRFIRKMLMRIESCYRTALYFDNVFPIITSTLQNDLSSLTAFLENSIRATSLHLGISTPMIVSSNLVKNDEGLSGQERVLQICNSRKATTYINAIGGIDIYERSTFLEKGIQLCFLKPNLGVYRQHSSEFTPNLSIIDVMMFNSVDRINEMLKEFSLL